MKKFIKNTLKKYNLYLKWRYSSFYFQILRIKNPQYIRSLNNDYHFYKMILGNRLNIIFDVGANHGDKAWVFEKIARKVVCVEPDSAAYSALTTRYGNTENVVIENLALGSTVGVGSFFIEEDGSCYNTMSEKEKEWMVANRSSSIRKIEVSVTTLDRLISQHGIPDFIKIDVEGFEKEVFDGLATETQIPVICFEANLPRFQRETVEILHRYKTVPEIKFNLRVENRMVFQVHKSFDEVIDLVSSNEEVTYDIFIFS